MEQDQISSLAPQKRFNLWLIATIVLAVLLLAGGVVFAWQKSVSNKVKNDLQGQINTLQNQIQQLVKTPPANDNNQCIAEGVSGGTEGTSKLTTCCAGLNKVDRSGIFEGICENASGQSIEQWFTCIKCGNGVCGTGENKCNCPADCSNASIAVEYPFGGAEIENPVNVSGRAETFENNVIIRIKDANGNILVKTNTIASGDAYDGILDSFYKKVSYSTPTTKTGFVEVFDESAKDGTEISLVKVSVVFSDYKK